MSTSVKHIPQMQKATKSFAQVMIPSDLRKSRLWTRCYAAEWNAPTRKHKTMAYNHSATEIPDQIGKPLKESLNLPPPSINFPVEWWVMRNSSHYALKPETADRQGETPGATANISLTKPGVVSSCLETDRIFSVSTRPARKNWQFLKNAEEVEKQ